MSTSAALSVDDRLESLGSGGSKAAAAQVAQADDAAAGVAVADINSGNYLGAWEAAEGTASLYNTNSTSVTTDPLLQAMESSSGLEALDPSKKWTASDVQAYYGALEKSPGYSNGNLLGKNPYGLWGNGADLTNGADAQTNESTAGDNTAPDVERFAGSRPETSFLGKYGEDIALLVAAVVAPELIGVIAPEIAAGAVAAGVGADTAATVGTVAAGAVVGAGESAAIAGGYGQNLGKAAELGAVGGAVGGAEIGGSSSAVSQAESAFGEETGAGTLASDVAVQGGLGAAAGAAKGEISGTGALKGAEVGLAVGGIGGAVQASGITNTIGKTATGVGTKLATTAAADALTSDKSGSSSPGSSNGSSTGLSAGVAPLAAGAALADSTAAAPTTFSDGLGQGLDSSFGLNSAGTVLGNLGTLTGQVAPYAAVAAVGEAQAKAGQAEDAKFSQQQQALAQPSISESNQLLNQYNTGTLTPAQQQVVTSGEQQGQSLIDSAASLSTIAQTAFSNYNSGTLKPADQTALDQQTAAQKQQVAQQLASAGITDSTILAAQNQQIDNNAQIQKQNILNGYFSTGNQAYDTWLQSTTQGQQTIQAAQMYASTSLQTTLQNSMQEAGIGIGEMNTAITTQMQTDQKYADQVSTLLGNLAQAYSKQYASGGTGKSSAGSNLLKNAGGGGGGGTGTGTGSASDPDNPTAIGKDIDNTDTSDPFAQNTDGSYNDVSPVGQDNSSIPGISTGNDYGYGSFAGNPGLDPVDTSNTDLSLITGDPD
jgi:hypothetical protein